MDEHNYFKDELIWKPHFGKQKKIYWSWCASKNLELVQSGKNVSPAFICDKV